MTQFVSARSVCSARSRARGERGSALVVALLSLMLLTALGLALALTTASETYVASHHRFGQGALNAADAGLERAMQDLLTASDWNQVLAGAASSSFIDGTPGGTRALPDGTTINLSSVVSLARCGKADSCSDADTATSTSDRPWGPNNPAWQLYAYGPASDLLPTGTVTSPFYIVVLVGDDPSETDGNPLADGNTTGNPGTGVLSLRAECFGPRGTHRVVEATVARTLNSGQERGYVGQRGQDEQNRRARKAAVQTPGKALTSRQLSLTTGTVQ